MLVNFGPPGICIHDGGSIYLVPPRSVLPVFSVRGIDLLVPRTALGGPNPTRTGTYFFYKKALAISSKIANSSIRFKFIHKSPSFRRRSSYFLTCSESWI